MKMIFGFVVVIMMVVMMFNRFPLNESDIFTVISVNFSIAALHNNNKKCK